MNQQLSALPGRGKISKHSTGPRLRKGWGPLLKKVVWDTNRVLSYVQLVKNDA